MTKEIRDLDGIFYRVRRGDKYVNRCFSDLTDNEKAEMTAGYNKSQYMVILSETLAQIEHITASCIEEPKEMLEIVTTMSNQLKAIGDKYDIYGGMDDED